MIVENYNKMNRTLIGKIRNIIYFNHTPSSYGNQISIIFASLKRLNLITTGRGCYRSLRSLVDQPVIFHPKYVCVTINWSPIAESHFHLMCDHLVIKLKYHLLKWLQIGLAFRHVPVDNISFVVLQLVSSEPIKSPPAVCNLGSRIIGVYDSIVVLDSWSGFTKRDVPDNLHFKFAFSKLQKFISSSWCLVRKCENCLDMNGELNYNLFVKLQMCC